MKRADLKLSEALVKGFFVALEVTGTPQLSDGAVAVILKDLSAYPEEQVLRALKRCCRELKGKLTLADIVSRLDDGRPSPEEAWAMVPKDESSSAMMTAEMSDAYAIVYPMVAAGELIPARMAFLEKYRGAVQYARDGRMPVTWTFSPGTDRDGRELVILDAAQKGRISVERAQDLLPYHREETGLNARLLAIVEPTAKLLTAPPALSDAGKQALERMREIVAK